MIELRNIGLAFKNLFLFRSLDYKIMSGDKVLLDAPSGTGKTSIFRLLLGFTQPTEGEVLMNGKILTPDTIQAVRARIGYLSQDADMPSGKVGEVIHEIFGYQHNKDKQLQQKKLLELLDYFELRHEVLEQAVTELSGGERQRVLLTILILLDRDVYLLDEPTSALDEKLKVKVRDLFLDLSATVLVISHDLVWSETNRIIVFRWQQRAGWEDGQ